MDGAHLPQHKSHSFYPLVNGLQLSLHPLGRMIFDKKERMAQIF